jgi:hypothetical protein
VRATWKKHLSSALRTETVSEILQEYARRGVFRGFSRAPDRRGHAVFKIVWHRGSSFDLVYDPKENSLRCPCVLPNIPANSNMYRDLKLFIRHRVSDDLPDHRRIDRRLATAAISNRRGIVSVALTANSGDCQYVTRKLVHLMHEIYMTFLLDGKYFDYVVETFNLDPDSM